MFETKKVQIPAWLYIGTDLAQELTAIQAGVRTSLSVLANQKIGNANMANYQKFKVIQQNEWEELNKKIKEKAREIRLLEFLEKLNSLKKIVPVQRSLSETDNELYIGAQISIGHYTAKNQDTASRLQKDLGFNKEVLIMTNARIAYMMLEEAYQVIKENKGAMTVDERRVFVTIDQKMQKIKEELAKPVV